MAAFLPLLSLVFGWVYTIAWSLSFYPQLLLNRRRRSTSGTTVDYPLVNTLGFAAYAAANTALYASPLVRAQYAARSPAAHAPTTRFNDVMFAAHACVLSALGTSQYLGFARAWGIAPARARPSRGMLGLCAGCVVGVVAVGMLAWGNPEVGRARARGWCELDVVYAVSYVKLVITLVKYTPQLLANYRNRSTRGWAISPMLLDFLGGALSMAQLAIDSYLLRDWGGLTGNPVKLALGNVSMAYDMAFFFQHYVLYKHANGDQEQGLSANSPRAENDDNRRLD